MTTKSIVTLEAMRAGLAIAIVGGLGLIVKAALALFSSPLFVDVVLITSDATNRRAAGTSPQPTQGELRIADPAVGERPLAALPDLLQGVVVFAVAVPLFGGVVLLAVAVVFTQGARLREDTDGLV